MSPNRKAKPRLSPSGRPSSGPPALPAQPGPRPPTIVNLDAVEPVTVERPRVVRARRNLGRAAGSRETGLQHVEVAPGKEATAQHCHTLEEEIFVILGGDGTLVLGQQETPVRAGHVIARPAGTGGAPVSRRRARAHLSPTACASPTTCAGTRARTRSPSEGLGVMGRIRRGRRLLGRGGLAPA